MSLMINVRQLHSSECVLLRLLLARDFYSAEALSIQIGYLPLLRISYTSHRLFRALPLLHPRPLINLTDPHHAT